jgi:hypothetical protein
MTSFRNQDTFEKIRRKIKSELDVNDIRRKEEKKRKKAIAQQRELKYSPVLKKQEILYVSAGS